MTPDAAGLAAALQRGGVVLLPTDTIYGLHAVASSEEAIRKLVSIKGRHDEKPFVVLGSSRSQLESLGVLFPESSRPALDQLWPGPLTAVVGLEAPIPASRGRDTLAVRVPALPWLRELLEATGPLASTSANRSGELPLTSVRELPSDLQRTLDAVMDAGPLEGKPSTIVDFTGDEPRLIRKGDRLFTQKVWKTLRKSL
ncbi:MAG TPA: L-threonylcarbamoyladenylate synthase [Thermoanaerobaculia bacterium]|nr:L-threonylcarbamoyladenylate synthase [Thermoanaerobaculia bacterium]